MSYLRTLLDARITEIRVPQITTPHRVRIQADMSKPPRRIARRAEADAGERTPAEISRSGHRANLSSAGGDPPAEAEPLSAGEIAGERGCKRGCTLSSSSLARVPTDAYVSRIPSEFRVIYLSDQQ